MIHEYSARALRELMQVGKAPASTYPVLHHAPEAFNRIEVMATMRRQEIQPKLLVHCGHHLNPIEGFWRVMKDRIGAGRCFPDLHQLYQRTRRVLMAHQERPIYAFHWR